MKKTVVFLAVVMAMFMMPMVSSAVGIDGTISMDTELIEFNDEWHDTDEWFIGDGGEAIQNINQYLRVNPDALSGSNSDVSTNSLVAPAESFDINVTLPAYGSTSGIHSIVGEGATLRSNLGVSQKVCLYGLFDECCANCKNNKRYECTCSDSTCTLKTVYCALEGGCADEEYVYFAFYVYYMNGENYVTLCQKIVCGRIDTLTGDFTVEKIRTFTNLEHANSLTYNSRTNEVIVAHCAQSTQNPKIDQNGNTFFENVGSAHYGITAINADYLQGKNDNLLSETHYISCKTSAIDYNEKTNQYIVSKTGDKYTYVILDHNFQVVDMIEVAEAPEDVAWSRQSSWCDGNYIYGAYYYKEQSSSSDDVANTRSAISIIDIASEEIINEINFKVNDSSDMIYEIENIFEIDGKIIVGFICKGGGGPRYYDLSNLGAEPAASFGVRYYANTDALDSITALNNADKDEVKTSVVIRKVMTKLQRNTFTNKKSDNSVYFKFIGWTLYNKKQEMWQYVTDEEKGTREWLAESQAGSYRKYIYTDETEISKIVAAGNELILFAQWADSDKMFKVSYYPNGGTGTMTNQECEYEKKGGTQLSTNNFTKTGTSFKGWHAYWVEKDKWYYQSADGSTKAWYIEGKEPEGYRKYVYKNNQNVVQTVTAGQHVEMYAVWNEIIIQYYAGPYDIINVKIPTNMDLGTSSCALRYWYSGKGWYMYWKETDKWYYGTSDGWLNYNANKTRYINTSDTITNSQINSFSPGDHLIVCWKEKLPEGFDF